MKDWSISVKLLCLIATAIFAFVGLGLYGISNTRSTFKWVKEVNATAKEFQRSATEISDPLHRLRELALSIVLAPDRALREELHSKQEEKIRRLDETFKRWPTEHMDAPERAAFERLREALQGYKTINAVTIDRAITGYREEAFINAIDAGARQFDLVNMQLEGWQTAKIDSALGVYQDADAQFKRVVVTSILVTVLTALLLGSVAYFIVRTITGPINILTATASRIAEKVDDSQAEGALAPVLRRGGEVGQLARGFWRMVGTLRTTIQTESQSRARLNEILRSTRQAVGQLGSTSAQLLASTKEQAVGAEKQADAVARIATTVDEVTHTAQQAAARASGVGKTVQRTLEIGKAGRRAVNDSVSALHAVRQQAEQTARNMVILVQQTKAISDIIATVDDIARQSHVLAVNAAIEAAKAGQGAKEFTVIASEIRVMAERSRQGTSQIRQILDQILRASSAAVESMEGVTKGVTGAIAVGDQSSQTIKELAVALSEVAETSAQTVVSAEQEALGMSQINEAMKNIDHVSRQALLAIQGTAQAAGQLNDLGSHLTQLSAE